MPRSAAGRGNATMRRERRTCSVSLVIAIFTACVVVLVATVTLAITYTTSLATLRGVGRSYALALVETATEVIGNVFEIPARHLHGLTRTFALRPEVQFPSDDLEDAWRMSNLTFFALLPLFRAGFANYESMGITFDDGSISALQFAVPNFGYYSTNARLISNKTRGCCAPYLALGYSHANMTPGPVTFHTNEAIEGAPTAVDGAYLIARSLVYGLDDVGVWFSPLFVDYRLPGVWTLPALMPVRNSSGCFIGVAAAFVRFESISEMLRTDRRVATPNTHFFMVDDAEAIAATSFPAPFERHTVINSTDPRGFTVPSNCVSTQFLRTPLSGIAWNFTIACRMLAVEYPYPPLQHAARHGGLLVKNATAVGIVFEQLTINGEDYYVAASRVRNSLPPSYAAFGVQALVVVPESDVIGNVVRARWLVVGVVAAVVVVFSAVAAIVTHIVLGPLKHIAATMRSTARLRRTDAAQASDRTGDAQNRAGVELREVSNLQDAFDDMRNAIDSFTRYIPRDAVADLIRSGDIDHVAMTPRHCTMMFVGIVDFMTIIARLDVTSLSGLVADYTDAVMRHVTAHGGVVDRVVGDTTVSVWGAPSCCEHQELRAVLSALWIDHGLRLMSSSVGDSDARRGVRGTIGISTGVVLAGNIGPADRLTYTVLGAAVKRAANVQSLCTAEGARLLVDAETALRVRRVACLRELPAWPRRSDELGEFPIVFEVIGLLSDLAADVVSLLSERSSERSSSGSVRSQELLTLATTDDRVATDHDPHHVTAAALVEKARASLPSCVTAVVEALAACCCLSNQYFREGHFAAAIEAIDGCCDGTLSAADDDLESADTTRMRRDLVQLRAAAVEAGARTGGAVVTFAADSR